MISLILNIYVTFDTLPLLVFFDGIILWYWDGLLLLFFLATFNSFMPRDRKSSPGNHFALTTLMLHSLRGNAVEGTFSLNITPFRERPPLFKTSSSWSALSKTLLIFSGYSSADILLSLSVLSLTDFCLVLHHTLTSLSPSHLVTSYCPTQCVICITESTNAPL